MYRKDISFINYYDIDLNSQTITFLDSDSSGVLTEYITKSVNYVLNESTKCQQYRLKRETNEVYNIITKSILSKDPDVFNSHCKDIADMLLDSEIRITKGAIEPISGGLIQAVVKRDSGFYYVLIKNEFVSAVNRNTMEMIEAFLHDEKKKSPLKICIFDLILDNTDLEPRLSIGNIYIDDSIQKNHSVYWYDYFLNLDKCNSDEVNTNNAVDRIIQYWEDEVEDPYEALTLRNDTIAYFRANDCFDMDNFIQNIDARHNTIEPEILDNLKNIATNKRKGFDLRFDISQSGIKKRIITRQFYPLVSKTISLSIVGEIDFNDIYIKEENGNHFLKIRTDNEETIRALTQHQIK